jgi:hypothetical protein
MLNSKCSSTKFGLIEKLTYATEPLLDAIRRDKLRKWLDRRRMIKAYWQSNSTAHGPRNTAHGPLPTERSVRDYHVSQLTVKMLLG